jgi:GDP-L-fucose synthase
MNLLITGASGFIGRSLAEYFYPKQMELFTPTHAELELTDAQKVEKYIHKIRPNVIIHCAGKDTIKCMKNNIVSFFNITSAFNGKIICFGSGGEKYNTEYGLSKRVINHYATQSDNIYCLRLYAVYGKYERQSRFPAFCLRAKKKNETVNIPVDRWMDYLYINDLCKIVKWFIGNTPKYNSYDVCTNKAVRLSDVAQAIGVKYTVHENSWSVYGGDNKRLLKEMPFTFTPLISGVKEYASQIS